MGRISTIFLKGIFSFFFSLWVGSLMATTYYVSNSGNDALAGTSTATAWQTISKVNSITLTAGDLVLFQAGGIWRETLNVRPGTSGAGHRIHYGRYGVGKNPQILGSNKAENWTATGTANIWQSATSLSNPRAGGLGYPAEIFFVANDSTSWGDFQTYSANYSNLTKEYDWTWNGNVLFVYSAIDPDAAYQSVEAPQRDMCMSAVNTACSYIEVNGIDLHYAKISGYRNGYPEMRGATDLTFKNCHISYIGEKSGTAAYGVEAFHSNFLVDSCVFSDCGRRAVSMNFYVAKTAGNEIYIDSVIVRNSRFKRGQHTTSLDFGVEAACVGDTFLNIYYYNNIVDDHEIAMTGNDRTSNQVYFQPTAGYMSNVYVFNNLFIQATARNILITGGNVFHVWNNTIISHNPNIPSSPYSNVSFGHLVNADYRNNITFDNLPDDARNNYGVLMEFNDSRYIARDYNLYFQAHENASRRGFTGGANGYFNISGWSSYRSTNPTFDVHSPNPQNPAFIDFDNFDYRLTTTSAAKGTGTPIPMVKTDLLGNPRDLVHPSIGAYEYYTPNPTAANIASFSFAAQTKVATIVTSNHTVSIEVKAGTNLSNLVPVISVSPGATINPASGVARNFSTPVTYTVTASNGTTQQVWTVTVSTASASTEANILGFTVAGQTGVSAINTTNHTVTIGVPNGTNVTSMSPTISVSDGATINPATGIATNFTNPVQYTVTAQDGVTQQIWTVTIVVAQAPGENNLPVVDISYEPTTFKGMVYSIDASNSFDLDNQALTFSWDIPAEISASSLIEPLISILPTENASPMVYTITLNVSDGIATVSKSISIGVYNFDPNAKELKFKSIEASGYEIGNEPENIIDDNYNTRWSADGDGQWMIFELESDSYISYFDLSFYGGENRSAYFDIFASNDKTNWDLILNNSSSCGFSPNIHAFEMPGTKASTTFKYIKLVGHMNTVNTWNSFTEFKAFGSVENPNSTNSVDMDQLFEVYPNPASENVFVKTENAQLIRVIDITGAVIYEQSNVEGVVKINYDFPSGIYFIQLVNNNNNSFTKKLLVK